jgi:predicted MFS family arabinose efflux permease
LLLAFGQGHSWGWGSSKIVGLFIIGGIPLMLFIVRELSTKTPLLNIRVFRNGRYTLSLIITNILTISLYAGTLLAPVFLQKVQGVTAMDTGLLLLPSSFVMALVMPLAGKLYGRVGPRWLMSVGVIFLALGTLSLSWFSSDVSHTYIVFMMTLRNIGVALIMIPASYGTELMSVGDTNKIHIGQMAFTMSINDVFFITTIISILAFPVALFIGKVKKSEPIKA